MRKSFANPDVLKFYQKLPFNYYGDTSTAAETIRKHNAVQYYPILPPLLNSGITVLDVGCGAGWLVNGINYYYGGRGTTATGLDYNAVAIQQAQEVAARLGVRSTFVESDLFEYRPSARYDLVTSVGVLHHTDDCIQGVRHIFRNLVKDGGHAFIGLYHAYGRKPFLDYFGELKRQGLSEEELLQEFMKFRSGSGDKIHDLSWFYDQVLHPHETQHTLEEMIALLQAEHMELTACSINRFGAFRTTAELIEREKTYLDLARQRLKDKIYFPGFFLFLAKKLARVPDQPLPAAAP